MEDKEYYFNLLRKGTPFSQLPSKIKEDSEVIIHVLKKNGYNLLYLSKNHRDNEIFVKTALASCGYALSYISERLKYKKDIVMTAVKSFPLAIIHAPDIFRSDKDIAMEAVRRSGLSYRFFSSSVRGDKQILRLSVKSNPYCFSYAPNHLRQDKEFVISCLEHSPYIFYYIDPALRDDYDVVRKVISKSPTCFRHASKRIRNDKNLLLDVINAFPYAYHSITCTKMKVDKDVVFQVLKRCESLFLYIPANFKRDVHFLTDLTQQNIRVFYYLPVEIRTSRDFVLKVYWKNKKIKDMLPPTSLSNLKDLENCENFVSTLKKDHNVFHCSDLKNYIQTFLF